MRNTIYDFYCIGAVDPDYKHIWGFQTPQERDAFLSAHHVFRIENNAYWRPVDHTIKGNFSNTQVPSYERSYTFDYVRVTNRSDETGEQIYYLFIVGRSYINLNLTELIVSIDYIQTYYFADNVPFWQCSGYCLNCTDIEQQAPRGTGSEYPVTAYQNLYAFNSSTNSNIAFVVYSTLAIAANYETHEEVLTFQYSIMADEPILYYYGDLCQYSFTGSFPYIINNGSTELNCAVLKALNKDLTQIGQLASITGIYAIPAGLAPRIIGPYTAISMYKQDTAETETYAITIPSADELFRIHGIDVINPTLKGYDYTKIIVSNMSGEEVEYHYEDFSGNPVFQYRLSLDNGYPVQIMNPANYRYGHVSVPQLYAMKQTNPPQASMSSDNFAIWQAQNRNSIQASLDASKMTVANAEEVRSKTGGIASALDNLFDSAKDGMSDLLSGMGLSLPSGADDALTTAGYSGMNSLLSMGFLSSFGLEASYVYDQQVNVATQALRNVEASFKDQRYLPASVHGSNAYGDLLMLNQFGFMIIVIAPEDVQMHTLDLDLECNGHMVKRPLQVKQTRTIFDFWRILDAYIPNNPEKRPYFVTQMMVKLFSDGIYLWWTKDESFGHPYNLGNEVIEE